MSPNSANHELQELSQQAGDFVIVVVIVIIIVVVVVVIVLSWTWLLVDFAAATCRSLKVQASCHVCTSRSGQKLLSFFL